MQKIHSSTATFCAVILFCASTILPFNLAHSETSDEILNVSIKVNDQTKNLPLKITDAEPLFVKVEQNEVNSFVEISVYLATEAKKKFAVSSDLKDFFVTAEGAKTIIEGKDRVTFESQDSRVQIFAYGQVPKKSLFTVVRVVGETDLLNVLARSTSEPIDDTDVTQLEAKQSTNLKISNPLGNPVLKKLDQVITNSTLPNTDHYRLVQQDLEKMIREGKQEQVVSQALLIIDEIHEKESFFAQNKRECERSRLSIIQVEDLLSKSDIPKELLDDAMKELNHAKSYQQSFLCDEALASAEKATESVQLDPLTSTNMKYPWLLPAVIVIVLGSVALVAVQKYRTATLVGGLR